MYEMKIRIETKSPVILSAPGHTSIMTATQEFFSGSVLRGIFAERFIALREKDGTEPHEDADFMSLFYGGLRFVDANPVDPQTGVRTIHLPFSIQQSKDRKEIRDLIQAGKRLKPGLKSMKGLAAINGREVRSVSVNRTISLHISRSDLIDASGAERLAGKSKNGGIYNYEAIAAGQLFEGSICGGQELLQKLRKRMKDKRFSCYVGRSKYTQYGLCEISLEKITEAAADPIPSDGLYLRLETPFLPRAVSCDVQAGDVAAMIDEITAAISKQIGGTVHLPKRKRSLFAKTEEVDNFVGVWGLRRPRETALAAGTVFVLEKEGGWQPSDAAPLNEICRSGVGRRRAEGFGQLRLWNGDGLHAATEKLPTEPEPRKLCPATKILAEKILVAHVIETVRVRAAEDAVEAVHSCPTAAPHSFARLECELGTNIVYARQSMMNVSSEAAKKEKSPLYKTLTSVKIGGCALYEYFKAANRTEMPYTNAQWSEHGDLIRAIDEVGIADGIDALLGRDEVYYAYWSTFFRFARKAAGKQEEAGA